jgi:hypothetical protein
VKLGPQSKRLNPRKVGVENTEYEALEAAQDENGVVDPAKVFPVPEASGDTSSQQTVLKIMDEKGYVTEENLYQKEYQLRIAHRILINGGSTTMIAQKLNISPAQARKLKNELSARLIQEVKSLDKNKVAGKALMFYDHIQAKALQLVGQAGDTKSLRTQVEALKVALQAETDKQKFLVMAGFWNTPLDQGLQNYDSHIGGADEMRQILTGIVSGDEVEVFQDDEDESDGIDLL